MSLATAGRLYELSASGAALRRQRTNLVKSIWHGSTEKDDVAVNALSTLPIQMKSKAELYEQVRVENPQKSGWGLKLSQTTAYGKAVFRFYKEGVRNVWNNKREMNQLMKTEFKIQNQVDNKGQSVNLKVPSFSKLVFELTQALYMNKIENEQIRLATKGDVVKNDKVDVVYDEQLFNISRSQFQLINRTSKDFIKLPAFAVIFMIFVEMTPILCYVFPEITPSTCVLPSILPRLWDSKSAAKVRQLRSDESKVEDWALETAYNIPYESLVPLTGQLGLRSKYLPSAFYPESYLRNKLHRYYNYLVVDNYYLSGLNGNGNVWDLTDEELVQASLERCLISDVGAFVKIPPEAKAAELKKLRLKLLRAIIDMDNFSVGYLTVGHLLGEIESS
ncbi:hypothetical protein PGUG_03567 [Meyerozyma guilliermondii ATCC 6260]|uniref:Letm1 RBD domain-containing protein n=1 Tax=Meyerozyma guilliermondii (strain ATCC 6260 / CBS 566 / DSM 6381 / JCM 1539 / NBRC 10279 / NRRL Y-324) TaxID=294746 RepID=A5DJW6_PICGU|nr:uncharacterized protein PGUG_03567 [Meyerozyma guilliermondii ATCC 6260]EDK39470.2 hypothetical protein PGUG_03567 [Meyerozyma guilliermondii ATCC 6260]